MNIETIRAMITLDQISDLGFNFEKAHDSVYKEEYGIDYWIVTKQLAKKIMLEYSIETGTVRLIRHDKEGTILKSREVPDLMELINIINFWEDKK